MSELKRCPHCKQSDMLEIIHEDGYSLYYVLCGVCGISWATGYTKEQAIEIWNTRPIEDALEAECERLRGLLADAFDAVTTMDNRKLMMLRWNLRDMEASDEAEALALRTASRHTGE